MNKLKIFWIVCLVIFAMAACTDDETSVDGAEGKTEENLLPPGPDYTPQGKFNNNLNVIYYVPSDSDTVPLWHKRLSEIVLHMQEYYRSEMMRHGLGNKTFRLILNDRNPSYVKIIYMKSEAVSTADCQETSGIGLAQKDIMGWFEKNPSEMSGNHLLVFMPGESGNFFHGSYGRLKDGTPLGYAFVSCDHLGYSLENYKKKQADIGGVLHEVGHAFFLKHNRQKAGESPQVSLMSSGNWDYYPGNERNVILTLQDVMLLDQVQAFNEEENTYNKKDYYSHTSMDLTADRDNIYAKLRFTANEEVVGVGFYNDPWRSTEEKDANPREFTEYDALSYYVCADGKFSDKGSFVRNGNSYEVSVVMPWEDFDSQNKIPHGDYKNVKAEIRYRLHFKGGLTNPSPLEATKTGYRYYYQIHNENPDIEARYLDRSKWTLETTDGSNPKGLVDGIQYTGWTAPLNSEVVIDMKDVRKIRAFFLAPSKVASDRATCVKMQGSTDGKEYTDLFPVYYMSDASIESYEVKLPGDGTSLRYVKLTLLKAKGNTGTASLDEFSVFSAY